jgi:ADP-heptose:LPS heptosyltransferase
MRRLILKSGYSLGDIIMMTAAVRDLHRCYPGQFLTDVRTLYPELWEHNPYLTKLAEEDPKTVVIDCCYPLIDRCNKAPYHCLHGYIDFLNQRLGLAIRPTLFKGDIHLSPREKSWYSQVQEVTRRDIPFWIIVAGGKFDVTIKWWEAQRYQAVVDHFRSKIQFVQVGEYGHHHPPLKGVIDLRGQTSPRELIRLVYHAQGVLCPVTAVMHLAAAVEVKLGRYSPRPCVVVAGGREPVHWEAYPGHQFIHTIGALPCCSSGGCWRDRTRPLLDGDKRDHPKNLCAEVVNNLPRCMDMISAAEVIQRIESYFVGGVVNYLKPRQVKAAHQGVKATRANAFDEQPLNLHNARLACEAFIQTIPEYSGTFKGRGIVICGGGIKYLPGAWVCIRMLRQLGCLLPIQLWHLGPAEVDRQIKALFCEVGVECVDALALRKTHPARRLGGWELKAYALLHSPFREVLLLDADNVPVANPEYLFETPQFQKIGAIFWPDYGQFKKTQVIWDICGLKRPADPEFESGQIVVDKKRCWKALCLALWFNEQSDFYYQHLLGDKETFHLAFRRLGQPFAMPKTPIHRLVGTMCQHDFKGRRVFQHRNTDKWNLFFHNHRVPDFWYEEDCRGFVQELQTRWDGGMSRFGISFGRNGALRYDPPLIQACMISCAQRERLRERTLRNLSQTDWGNRPVHIQLDRSHFKDPKKGQVHNSYLALVAGIKSQADYLLFLEDDLIFNEHFYHNLCHWLPLRTRQLTFGGLYNPGIQMLACDVGHHTSVAASQCVYGSQAFLLSRSTAQYLVRHWLEVAGQQDIKMSRLAVKLKKPILYHTPSLVQHVGRKSTWGGGFHQARDFDPQWRNSQGL